MSKTGDQRAAVRVTTVVGSKEVVVKSAGLQLSIVPGIFGATIMGDGRVVVILDLAPLVRHGVALRQAPELAAELELLEPLPEPAARRQPLVMVVDDSSMEVIAKYLKADFRYSFTGWKFLAEEWLVLGISLILGFVAAIIPAMQAARSDINKTLSEK